MRTSTRVRPQESFEDELLRRLDHEIREGRSEAAREELKKIAADLAPELYAGASQIAWRAGAADLGIKWLHPLVRPNRPLAIEPSVAERAEYAACLIKIGSAEEAQALLKSLDEKAYPAVLLYRAFAFIAQWNYRAAIPILNAYLENGGLSSYQKMVGRINLAASLVFEQKRVPADYLLTLLMRETSARRTTLLLGNTLQLAAAHFVTQKNWAQAERAIKRAGATLSDSTSMYRFLVRKWELLFDYRRNGNTASLERLRAEATERSHWETLRDCDRFEALSDKNEELFRKIHFGTPFESFRERLRKDFGATAPALPREYAWRMQGEGRKEFRILFGENPGGGEKLKVGQVPHRLLSALASDFYRPWKLTALYFRIFPGDFYNPISSPHRVHESVRRLREWFRESDLPFGIDENNGEYRLVATAAASLVIPQAELGGQKLAVEIQRLRAIFGARPFAVSEVTKALKLPSTSALRLLSEAKERGLMTRTGQSRATRYQLVEQPE